MAAASCSSAGVDTVIGSVREDREDAVVDGVFQRGVARHHEHGHAPLFDGRPHGDLQQPQHLLGAQDHLAEDRAVTEQLGGPDLLEVLAANLVAQDVRGDREHGNPASVRVLEPVDEVHAAGAAAAGAHRELPRQRRLPGGSERGLLLMPGQHPLDALLPADRLCRRVQGVAGNSPDPLDPIGGEVVDNGLGNRGHAAPQFGALRRPSV